MRVVQKVRIGEERNLQLVRSKLDEVEFRPNVEHHDQLSQKLVQFGPEISGRVAHHIKRTRQALTKGKFLKAAAVFGQVHNSVEIHPNQRQDSHARDDRKSGIAASV